MQGALDLIDLLERQSTEPDEQIGELVPPFAPQLKQLESLSGVQGCVFHAKVGSWPLLVKRGRMQVLPRFLACRGEDQPTPFLGKIAFARRVAVAILRASPKVGKNPLCFT